MHPRALLLIALCAALGACGGRDTTSASRADALETHEPGDEPGSTRASREEARASGDPTRSAGSTAPATPTLAPPPPHRPLLSIHAIDAAEGEDGSGATIPATRPLAFDLDARQVPPRALDPVLHVGAQRFVHYVHPEPGVMRFVVADRALLSEGAPVFVQYGDEASTRLDLAAALELPAEVTP